MRRHTFPSGRIVTADVWIRNDSNRSAFLSVAALGAGSAAELQASLGLRVRSTLGSTARVPLGGPGWCSDLAVGWAVAPGERARLTVLLDRDLLQWCLTAVVLLAAGTGTLAHLRRRKAGPDDQ